MKKQKISSVNYLIILGLFIFSVLFIAVLFNTLDQGTTTQGLKEQKVSGIQQEIIKERKYQTAIYADNLAGEFLNNPIAAKRKYNGKEVIANGPIVYISAEDFGVPVVSLGSVVYQSVMCVLKDETQAYSLNTGDHVNVKGKVTGQYAMNVVLEQCVILN